MHTKQKHVCVLRTLHFLHLFQCFMLQHFTTHCSVVLHHQHYPKYEEQHFNFQRNNLFISYVVIELYKVLSHLPSSLPRKQGKLVLVHNLIFVSHFISSNSNSQQRTVKCGRTVFYLMSLSTNLDNVTQSFGVHISTPCSSQTQRATTFTFTDSYDHKHLLSKQ